MDEPQGRQSTEEAPVSKTLLEVVKEAKRIEESSLYSSKGHFTAARFWRSFHFIVGLVMAVLSGLAAALVLSDFDKNRVTSGLISILVAALSALQAFVNANERASRHFDAGNDYDALQNRVRIFWTIECWRGKGEGPATARLKDLSGQKDKLNRGSPQIQRWAYLIARRGIESGEASFDVDKE